ncbi:MAG: hypothetical protein F9K42_10710 [Ignavibacterium sp.]|nr:MAG: hypothetical protein F9K42_10710 [Ignavibacterium sp.]
MNNIQNFINSISYKSIIILISIGLILHTGCGGSRIGRISQPSEQFKPIQGSEELPYLKLHMKNGDLYLIEDWSFTSNKDSVKGTGNHYNLNREIIAEGEFSIPSQQVVLAETNQINGSAGPGLLTILTIVTGIFTVFCIVNPKACFGSCPTFYAFNGEDFIVQSEGFSSSISPSLEERDIDALYRIKPKSKDFTIQLKNEAYETHVIRSANLLALPKPDGGRVFATPDDEFYQAVNLSEATSATAFEGDVSEKVCSFDGVERFSEADSNDLSAKETVDLTFIRPASDTVGLVIAARQTLLTTFLFYQTLAYMGTKAGDWLANLERNEDQFKSILQNPKSVLGSIEVLVQNENAEWIKVGEIGETGPIATDIKIVPFKSNSSDDSSIKIKLRMAKGLWRIDYVALAELKNRLEPIVIQPFSTSPSKSIASNLVEVLTNPDSVLVTYPGDEYLLNYKLPEDFNNYELFIEPQGYYLEWMRNEWLAEENPDKVYQMFFNPQKYYKDLVPQFKKVEADMEETFWSSKYVYP